MAKFKSAIRGCEKSIKSIKRNDVPSEVLGANKKRRDSSPPPVLRADVHVVAASFTVQSLVLSP